MDKKVQWGFFMNRYAVVLAAGQGTRMKSKLYKVLHPVCGKPMVEHVVDQVLKTNPEQIVTIIGHGADLVKTQLGNKCEFALQEEQLGTAHAVIQAGSFLKDKQGTTLVMAGDTPLITAETMAALLSYHEQEGAKATILTAKIDNPEGYGRVIRDENDLVNKIVEHKDASEMERQITEINTATYCFDNEALFYALSKVDNNNVQGEYYLPDVIEILQKEGHTVAAYETPNFDETLGVNDRVALSQAEKIMKQRINEQHMKNGVTIIDPDNTYIETDVRVGQDVILYPGTILKGKTEIGEDTEIGPQSEIVNSQIGNATIIRQSIVHDSQVGNKVNIGPFAHIRPQTEVADEVKVGNFVELKKVKMGKGSKASHLSYLGDAEIGKDVNVGCGTITVNYDGVNKYLTKIEDGAFIGCNSNLIAPVKIGENAYIAAGSTITDDVPSKALSIARVRQTNKEGYVDRLNLNKK